MPIGHVPDTASPWLRRAWRKTDPLLLIGILIAMLLGSLIVTAVRTDDTVWAPNFIAEVSGLLATVLLLEVFLRRERTRRRRARRLARRRNDALLVQYRIVGPMLQPCVRVLQLITSCKTSFVAFNAVRQSVQDDLKAFAGRLITWSMLVNRAIDLQTLYVVQDLSMALNSLADLKPEENDEVYHKLTLVWHFRTIALGVQHIATRYNDSYGIEVADEVAAVAKSLEVQWQMDGLSLESFKSVGYPMYLIHKLHVAGANRAQDAAP